MLDAKPSPPAKARPQRGFTITELLIVVALMGILAGISTVVWRTTAKRTRVRSTAQLTRTVFQQARFLAVFRSVNHFVVIDPGATTIAIYEDSNAPFASFDNGDTLVTQTSWDGSVRVKLPIVPATLPDPNGGGNLADAWSMPLPDNSARWGTDLRGVLMTPEGTILSAEATPTVIGAGTLVMTDDETGTTSVTVDGRSGLIRAFRFDYTAWEEI